MREFYIYYPLLLAKWKKKKKLLWSNVQSALIWHNSKCSQLFSSNFLSFINLPFVLINLAKTLFLLKYSIKVICCAFRCIEGMARLKHEYNSLKEGLNNISQVMVTLNFDRFSTCSVTPWVVCIRLDYMCVLWACVEYYIMCVLGWIGLYKWRTLSVTWLVF